MLAVRKQEHGACTGQEASPSVSHTRNSNDSTITVAVAKSTATVVKGTFGGVAVKELLDSGSLILFVQYDVLQGAHNIFQVTEARPIQLVTASGD